MPPTADQITQQLSSIATKLDTIDALAAEVATPKVQAHNVQSRETSIGPHDKSKALWSDEEDINNPWWLKNPSYRHHTKMEFPKFEENDPRG